MLRKSTALLAMVAALAFAGTAGAAVDTSMLSRWTPHSRAEMRAADPVALSYLAKGWLLAHDQRRANVILDELERRGTGAYTAGRLHSLVGPGLNPADTVYTIAVVQVADAYRAAGRGRSLARAVAQLRAIPTVHDGGCYAYSAADAAAGCIQDIGGITLAVTSRVRGFDYRAMLAYEQATILGNGSWVEWQDTPDGQVEDAAHLAWTAFMLLGSPDPAVRDLGRRAAAFVAATYDPATAPAFSIYAVAAAEIATDVPGGCALAAQLPGWAAGYRQTMPDGSVTIKNQQWAAYVYTWAQIRC